MTTDPRAHARGVYETRDTCPAEFHDTATAYRKQRCRCPLARQAEINRKAKYDRNRQPNRLVAQINVLAHMTIADAPPFRLEPGRACANLTDLDLFFREEDTRQAQALCAVCPFQKRCAEWAVATDQVFGVWGGTTPRQRRAAMRRRIAQERAA